MIALLESSKPAGINPATKQPLTNPDGSIMTEGQWFQREIFEKKLNEFQRSQFAALTLEAKSKKREKETELAKAEDRVHHHLDLLRHRIHVLGGHRLHGLQPPLITITRLLQQHSKKSEIMLLALLQAQAVHLVTLHMDCLKLYKNEVGNHRWSSSSSFDATN